MMKVDSKLLEIGMQVMGHSLNPLARSLTPLTDSLTPHCSLRSIVCSLANSFVPEFIFVQSWFTLYPSRFTFWGLEHAKRLNVPRQNEPSVAVKHLHGHTFWFVKEKAEPAKAAEGCRKLSRGGRLASLNTKEKFLAASSMLPKSTSSYSTRQIYSSLELSNRFRWRSYLLSTVLIRVTNPIFF